MNNVIVASNPDWESLQKVDTPEQSKKKTLQELLLSAKVDLEADLVPPEVAIYAINDNEEKVPICTLGNFSLIIGKAKSKKTFFTSMLAAAALSEWPVGKLQGSLPPSKNEVIFFDTEQGAYHVQKVARRIMKLANTQKASKLHVYGLRRFSYKERIELIEAAISIHDRVGLVIIDGSRDCVADINNAEESVLFVGKVMKISEESGIHIICVLHQNKGDSNARGHLGTESVNKAETVLSVTRDQKDKSLSFVDPEYCRDKDPDQIVFEINQEGIPVMIDYSPQNKSKFESIKEPFDIDELTHREILSTVFSYEESPTYNELLKLLMVVLPEKGIPFKKTKSEQLITWYKVNEKIKTNGKDGTRHCRYLLH